MKWFQHNTDFSSDINLSRLLDTLGLKGYGFFFLLLEIVAAKVVDNNFKMTLPEKHWAKIFQTYPKQFENTCKTLETLSLINFKRVSNLITIEIPMLSNLLDNFTKKKSKSTYQVRSKYVLQYNTLHNNTLHNNNNNVGCQSDEQDSNKESACPYDEIVKLFNECLPELNNVKAITPSRQKILQARWQENWPKYTFKGSQEPSLEGGLAYWRNLFRYIKNKCPFLMGNKGDFKATFDWIIDANNFQKIIEHNYKEEGVNYE